jgi:hypothetical protein
VVALAATPFLCAPWHVSSFLVSYAIAYAMLRVADHIHMRLHVRGHPWERYQWFIYLRSLHYWHHAGDMKVRDSIVLCPLNCLCQRNYAIGDFFLDFLVLGFRN